MTNYKPQDFIDKINTKIDNKIICPYCKGNNFTTPESFVSIIVNNDLDSVKLGPTLPCGVLICENCGHIDFFALGTLGLLQRKENNNGEQN